jgi:hypothetical protein
MRSALRALFVIADTHQTVIVGLIPSGTSHFLHHDEARTPLATYAPPSSLDSTRIGPS